MQCPDVSIKQAGPLERIPALGALAPVDGLRPERLDGGAREGVRLGLGESFVLEDLHDSDEG